MYSKIIIQDVISVSSFTIQLIRFPLAPSYEPFLCKSQQLCKKDYLRR